MARTIITSVVALLELWRLCLFFFVLSLPWTYSTVQHSIQDSISNVESTIIAYETEEGPFSPGPFAWCKFKPCLYWDFHHLDLADSPYERSSTPIDLSYILQHDAEVFLDYTPAFSPKQLYLSVESAIISIVSSSIQGGVEHCARSWSVTEDHIKLWKASILLYLARISTGLAVSILVLGSFAFYAYLFGTYQYQLSSRYIKSYGKIGFEHLLSVATYLINGLLRPFSSLLWRFRRYCAACHPLRICREVAATVSKAISEQLIPGILAAVANMVSVVLGQVTITGLSSIIRTSLLSWVLYCCSQDDSSYITNNTEPLESPPPPERSLADRIHRRSRRLNENLKLILEVSSAQLLELQRIDNEVRLQSKKDLEKYLDVLNCCRSEETSLGASATPQEFMAARDKVLATPRPLEKEDDIQSAPSVPESVATWRQSLLVAEKVIYNVTMVNQAMVVLSRRHFAPYQKIPKAARMKKILLRPTIPRMRESFATSTTVTTPSSAQEFGSSGTSYTMEQVDVLGTPEAPSCPSTTGNDETESVVDPLVESKIDLRSSDEPEEDDVHDQTMDDQQAHELQVSVMEFSAIPEVTITPFENGATTPSAIIAERQQDLIDESATSSAVLASSVSEYDEVTSAMEIELAHREVVDRQDDDMASSWSHTHDAQVNLEVADDTWIRGSENDDSSMYEVTSSDQTAMEFDLATEIWTQVDELRLSNDIVSLASQAPSDANMVTLDAVEGDFFAGEYLPAPTFGTGGFGLFEQTHFPVGIDLVCGRDAFAQPDIRAARSEDPSVLYPALVIEGELPHNLQGEGTLGNEQSASLPRTYPNIDLDYGEAVDEGIGAMSNQDYMQLYPALFQTDQSVYSTSATESHIPALSDWDIETPDEASGKETMIPEKKFTSVDYTCLDENATIVQILGEVPFPFPVAAPSLPSQGTNVDEQNDQPLWIAEQHQAVHDLIFGQDSPPQSLLELPVVPEAMPEEEPWKRGQAEAVDLLRSLAEHQKQDPFSVIMTDIPTLTSIDSGRHIDSTGRMVEVRRWKPSKPQAKPVASGVSPPASLTQSEALLSVLANNAEENEINNAPAPTFMPSVTPHAHPAPLTTEGLVQLQGYNGTNAVMIDPLLVSAEAVLANNPGLERSAALQQAFAQAERKVRSLPTRRR